MIRRLFLLIGLISLVSCTNEIEESIPSSNEKQVIMTVKDFEWDKKDSRTIINVSPVEIYYQWAENDTVGIVPNIGTQVAFPIINGVGSNTATFSGGAWALRPSSTYAAYYPFIGDIYLDKTKIPVSYEGQTQVGNASTAHLGKYDFMAAVAITPETGNVKFDFNHLGCLVELNMILPRIGNYTSVTLSCDEAVFIKKGSVDLTSNVPQITSIGEKSKDITITLESLTTTKVDEIAQVYFLVAPIDLTGKTLNIKVNNSGLFGIGTVTIDKKWNAGKAYKLHVAKKEVPSTVQWVDLGLPSGVKWASHNIGASKPEEAGHYFEWSEIFPEQWKSSKSYVLDGLGNHPIGNISGDPKYDAATFNWGSEARMPTNKDIDELLSNCSIQWTTQNGITGALFTSKNKNTIFFPAAGYLDHGLQGYNEIGLYWGSESELDGQYCYGYYLHLNDGYFGRLGDREYNSFSIRPVRN